MSRIFIDGFEAGQLDLWDTINGGAVSSAEKRSGSYSYYCNGNQHTIVKNISAVTEIYFHFGIYPTSIYNSALAYTGIIYFSNASGYQCYLMVHGSTKYLVLRRGDGTTLGTGTTALQLNVWQDITGYLKIDNAAGIGQIKLDGNLEIDYSGDTQHQAANTITEIMFGEGSGASYYVHGYRDDFILDDSSWIPDSASKIQAIVPNGAGNSTQWDPSAGSNWDCVEEIPASDAEYVYTNVNNEIDLYVASNLVGSIGGINCVQVQARSQKTGSPTPQNLNLAVRSGGSDYFSSDIAIQSSWASLSNIWETDPATAVAWTESGVNAVEIGVKSKA